MAVPMVSASPPRDSGPWRVIAHSVRGASHVRRQMRNQDSYKYVDAGGQVILALADGHGSAKSFRSDTGSQLAVDASVEFASELLKAARQADSRFFLMVKDQLNVELPRRIVHRWKELVDEDLARNPFTDAELDALVDQDGPESRRQVERDNRLAYGSTLITAIALESFAVFWQIGDGDVLTISSDRKVGRPVRGDDRLIANETTSLCSAEAWRMFRSAVLGQPAPMIMLSTDGFSNSFQDDAGFFKFGIDVSDIIAAEGLAPVEDSLSGWLDEISARGSGDDISLGIICRPAALPPRRRVADPGQQEPAQMSMMMPVEEPPLPPSAPQSPSAGQVTSQPILPPVVDQPEKVPQELQKTLIDPETSADSHGTEPADSRTLRQRTAAVLRLPGSRTAREEKKDDGKYPQGYERTAPSHPEPGKHGSRDN